MCWMLSWDRSLPAVDLFQEVIFLQIIIGRFHSIIFFIQLRSYSRPTRSLSPLPIPLAAYQLLSVLTIPAGMEAEAHRSRVITPTIRKSRSRHPRPPEAITFRNGSKTAWTTRPVFLPQLR